MELGEVGPPSGPIFQPGLVELTSPWWWWGPLNSFMPMTDPGPAQAARDTAAQQMGSRAGIFPCTKGTVAAFIVNSQSGLSVYIQGRSDR